jgi:hypothetical protein
MQLKTKRPVQFEITDQTRTAVAAWIETKGLKPGAFLFPSKPRPIRSSVHATVL